METAKIRYMVEYLSEAGWSTEGISDSDENVTFDSEDEAQKFIDYRVENDDWNEDKLRIVEV